MKMFRKHKKSVDQAPAARKVTAVEMIIRKSLEKLALYLQSKTEMLPIAILKIMLIVFCLTWSIVCLYLILSAFTSVDKNRSLIVIEKIQAPRSYPGADKLKSGSSSVNRDYSRVQSFRSYMDNLNNTDKGRLIYDSILLARPHLLDSIRLLDVLQSQQK